MWTCESCGQENPDGFKFCGSCGAPLAPPVAPREVRKGDATRRMVRDAVQLEPVEVTAKGKGEPVKAFRLTDLDPQASGVTRRLDTPLVGRDRELALLRHAFERAVGEQSCHLVTL